jgi:hypothetical protein
MTSTEDALQDRIEDRNGQTFTVVTLPDDPRTRSSATKRRSKRNTCKPCPRCKRNVIPWKAAKDSGGRVICGECRRLAQDKKIISSLVE